MYNKLPNKLYAVVADLGSLREKRNGTLCCANATRFNVRIVYASQSVSICRLADLLRIRSSNAAKLSRMYIGETHPHSPTRIGS